MNDKQKKVVLGVIAVAALMLLFPPFLAAHKTATFNLGYSFLFSPPVKGQLIGEVNIGMLIVQWVCAIIVGGGLFLVLKTDKKNTSD